MTILWCLCIGQQLSKTNMVDIVDFCHQHKLLLLADEVRMAFRECFDVCKACNFFNSGKRPVHRCLTE